MTQKQQTLEQLVEKIKKALPQKRTKRGRPPKEIKNVLEGILYVLRSGCRWKDLPKGKSGCHYTTCWRLLVKLQEAGVWEDIHKELLEALNEKGEIDWSHFALDTSTVSAPKGGLRQDQTQPTEVSSAASVI